MCIRDSAVGVVLYAMLAGSLPFRGSTHDEIFRKVLHEPAPPLTSVRTDVEVPEAVEALVMRALAKSPDDRFASAPVSYTHLRAHETVLDIVCRLLLEKKTIMISTYISITLYAQLPNPSLV